MALVLPMIQKRQSVDYQTMDKANRILLAAEKTFAEKGFSKAKVADVARLAEVAEGTVYEYFANKEDLLLSIPGKRFQDHMDQLDETFQIRTPLGKLRRLIKNHFSLYLTNRHFLEVFIIQIQLSPRFYSSKAYETFRRYFRVIEILIETREGRRRVPC